LLDVTFQKHLFSGVADNKNHDLAEGFNADCVCVFALAAGNIGTIHYDGRSKELIAPEQVEAAILQALQSQRRN